MTSHSDARVAVVTCDPLLPTGDAGDAPLIKALSARGVDVSVVSWSDAAVAWDAFDLTILRSSWDYTERRDEFLRWLDRVPRLHNPADVVRVNTDKIYLRSLAEAGLPIVPTTFIEPGAPLELPSSGQFVVKPSVGAGSRGAGRFDADQPGELGRAEAHAAHLHAAGRTLLVQPYLTGVDSAGETALVFIDGQFSHGIRKGRMLAAGDSHQVDAEALFVAENISARDPSADEQRVARRILDSITEQFGLDRPLLYARIDLLPSEDGPVLVEAELTEPSLFLDRAPDAGERLAEAILTRAG